MSQIIDVTEEFRRRLVTRIEQDYKKSGIDTKISNLTFPYLPDFSNPGDKLSYDVEVLGDGIEYESKDPVLKPVLLGQESFLNCVKATNTQKFSVSKTRSDVFTWSLTEALKLTTSAKVSAKVPDLGGVEAGISMEFSLSSTQTHTTSRSQTWQTETDINVPPCSKVTATFVLSEGSADLSFTARVRITPQCVPAVNQYFHMPYPESLMIRYLRSDAPEYYIDNLVDIKTIQADDYIFTAKGTFSGVQGIDTNVRTDQSLPDCPKDSECNKSATEPVEKKKKLEV